MNDTRPPASELFVTQFLVVSDQDRSRDFYHSVFGAEVVRNPGPGHPGAGKYAHRAQYRRRPD
jgi:catechol 2,3-dioxygenase-like lactoylglutathione lyase family enzyme